MTQTDLFLEGRASWELRASAQGVSGREAARDCGVGRTSRAGSDVRYRWEAVDVGARPQLPAEAAPAAAWAFDPPSAAALEDGRCAEAIVALCRLAGELGAGGAVAALSGETRRKHVITGRGGASDERGHVRLRLRIARGDRAAMVARVYAGLEDLLADVASLGRVVAGTVEDLGRERVPCPEGAFPVVLGPGAPAHFFHEVYGHPLEGDVLARGGSYLASLLGRAIAEEVLTVVDDPLHPAAPAGHAVDDEGEMPRVVPLLDRGRVGGPLLHGASAARLGLPPTGHARRLDFRSCTLPRLTHVEVRGGAGTMAELVAPIARGLLVRSLRLRHLNAATGEFTCHIDDARVITAGEVGPPVGPALMAGTGLGAAAAVDAVAAGPEGEPAGSSGCGKLDQGPLTVSFQQPAVRFSAMEVRPWGP
jgi:TldD protein